MQSLPIQSSIQSLSGQFLGMVANKSTYMAISNYVAWSSSQMSRIRSFHNSQINLINLEHAFKPIPLEKSSTPVGSTFLENMFQLNQPHFLYLSVVNFSGSFQDSENVLSELSIISIIIDTFCRKINKYNYSLFSNQQ